jgi:hypothetical protein
MSKIEVNQVDPQSGTTLTLGTSGDTISIPAGVTLANSGTATGFASIAWQSTIVTTSTLTAVANRGYWIDTTSNACTITLPASASVGDQLVFVDYARNWGTNAITIDQNSLNFQGFSSPNPEYNTDGQSVSIVYSGATKGWIPTVDDDVSDEVPQPYSIDFLVVAGGAGGGSNYGAGGGAGGYRTSTQSFATGTVITVTVGDGGATATSGSNSSISGSGLTTITSAGGGKGGSNFLENGTSGGSGGGAAGATYTGGSGNTPSTSPSQGNNGGNGAGGSGGHPTGGGGGGASAVGGDAVLNSTAGNGGNGTASSITGSSVTRAGGGGGGASVDPPSTFGTGGTGGGGNGSQTGVNGNNGSVNTGGGGGGSGGSANGGSGGKGVVILAFPLADFSNTTTGSPTESDDGTTKVLIFNGDGSYTT